VRAQPVFLALLVGACGAATTSPPSGPPAEWTAWRERRTASLSGEDGWLTLVALCWLDEDVLVLGSEGDASCRIAEHAPARLGTVERRADGVHFVADPAAAVTALGAPVTDVLLVSDASDPYTVLEHGPLRFHLIDRGGRLGIRVKDRESPARLAFSGVPTYDYDAALRIPARFVAAAPGATMPIVNVLGMQIDEPFAGTLTFSAFGAEHTLTVMPGGDAPEDGLFLMLRDGTSGETTYGAGRYLDVPAPDASGATTVDLNFLETPPCGFTELATCPLPPPENELAVPIEGGERWLGEH
jgi:hypothetical protein